MIEITHVETFGFETAIRGMRNPYESHNKSDSGYCSSVHSKKEMKEKWGIEECPNQYECPSCDLFFIGKADMELAKKLIKAGPEHRKFLRMIHVQADVTAPRYWWTEMDKYKWVEANSSSTMHLIMNKKLTLDDFSTDAGDSTRALEQMIIPLLNASIAVYDMLDTKEEKECQFRSIKQLLPESYNQLRTIDTNYEALISIHHQRRNHRLTEWREFCTWIEDLPYMDEFLEVKDAD